MSRTALLIPRDAYRQLCVDADVQRAPQVLAEHHADVMLARQPRPLLAHGQAETTAALQPSVGVMSARV